MKIALKNTSLYAIAIYDEKFMTRLLLRCEININETKFHRERSILHDAMCFRAIEILFDDNFTHARQSFVITRLLFQQKVDVNIKAFEKKFVFHKVVSIAHDKVIDLLFDHEINIKNRY